MSEGGTGFSEEAEGRLRERRRRNTSENAFIIRQ